MAMVTRLGWLRWLVFTLIVALPALLFLATAKTSRSDEAAGAAPQLVIDSSVAGDFEALAVETWAKFLTVFQARANCFGDVHLRAALRLNSRAVYDPASATVTVRVPATAALLREALVHEFAHHVEFQCPAHRQLRPRFLAAQGWPANTPWRLDDSPANTPASQWATIPSEQAAEATIELVLGRRQIPTGVKVKPEAIQVIRDWAAGE